MRLSSRLRLHPNNLAAPREVLAPTHQQPPHQLLLPPSLSLCRPLLERPPQRLLATMRTSPQARMRLSTRPRLPLNKLGPPREALATTHRQPPHQPRPRLALRLPVLPSQVLLAAMHSHPQGPPLLALLPSLTRPPAAPLAHQPPPRRALLPMPPSLSAPRLPRNPAASPRQHCQVRQRDVLSLMPA